jgi:hypothetical protein
VNLQTRLRRQAAQDLETEEDQAHGRG